MGLPASSHSLGGDKNCTVVVNVLMDPSSRSAIWTSASPSTLSSTPEIRKVQMSAPSKFALQANWFQLPIMIGDIEPFSFGCSYRTIACLSFNVAPAGKGENLLRLFCSVDLCEATHCGVYGIGTCHSSSTVPLQQ